MNLYSTRKIRKAFVSLSKEPNVRKKINNYFSDESIFNRLGVKECHIPAASDEIFITEDDLSKISLLGKLKYDKFFSVKKVPKANLDIHSNPEKFEVKSFSELLKILKTKQKMDNIVPLNKRIQIQRSTIKEKLLHEMPNDLAQAKIVSLDFEFFQSKEMITEFGISVKEGDIVNSYHYLLKNAHEIKSDTSLQRKFRFGETKVVTIDEMKVIINDHLTSADYLLFHDYIADYKLLNLYGMPLDKFENLKIIDTQFMHRDINNLTSYKGITLSELLTEANIEHKKSVLHNSGNDARYTLELLIKYNDKTPSIDIEISPDILPVISIKKSKIQP